MPAVILCDNLVYKLHYFSFACIMFDDVFQYISLLIIALMLWL